MKYVASRVSKGNKLFPSEIHIEHNGITIKIPGLFRGETKHFDYYHIASVEINTPLVGYSTITIFAGGTRMQAHGFTKAEAKLVKEGIDNGKNSIKNSLNTDKSGIMQTGGSGQQLSVADEIKKMKELLDNGIHTQQEFDAHKTKLLGNN